MSEGSRYYYTCGNSVCVWTFNVQGWTVFTHFYCKQFTFVCVFVSQKDLSERTATDDFDNGKVFHRRHLKWVHQFAWCVSLRSLIGDLNSVSPGYWTMSSSFPTSIGLCRLLGSCWLLYSYSLLVIFFINNSYLLCELNPLANALLQLMWFQPVCFNWSDFTGREHHKYHINLYTVNKINNCAGTSE